MKKIILLEDRPGRQSRFLDYEQIKDLKNIEGLYAPEKDKCKEMILKLNEGKTDELQSYDLIIIHRSALGKKGIATMNEVAAKFKKDIILFSGGLSQIIFNRDAFESVSINSKDFYSPNLLPFLEKYKNGETSSIMELIYGENWRLSQLMLLRSLYQRQSHESDVELNIRIDEQIEDLIKSLSTSIESLDNEIKQIIASL